MKLTLGFSPCPNDTFIFDAMVNSRIDTEGLEFDYFMADVEELNRKAARGEADITKMSCAAYPFAADNYLILDSGSALGYRNGPLLIANEEIVPDRIDKLKIAIPGKYTTANLLLTMAFPSAKNKTEYLFSDIPNAVINDEVDAGLLIHETRFTYKKKGLIKIADLGHVWGDKTGLPLPLGIICVNKNVPAEIALKINRVIARSLEQAYMDSIPTFFFVKEHSQESEPKAMSRHIKLFVNDFTFDLGIEGKRAIRKLLSFGHENGILPLSPDRIFLT